MAFDPDAYLAQTRSKQSAPQPQPAPQGGVFDPDAYLAGTKKHEMRSGEAGFFGDLKRGMGLSAMKTYMGAKDLIGMDIPDYEKRAMEMWKEDVDAGGAGATVGGITGDIMQMALPAGALTKGLKAAKFGRAALPVADVAAASGLAALKAPEVGETRGDNALQDGLGAVAGMGLGKTLGAIGKKAVKGLKVKPEAKALMDQGVYLTPGQATTNETVAGLERLMRVTPFLARGAKDAHTRARGSWDSYILKEAAPAGVTVSGTGKEGFKQLAAGVDDAYSKAWSGVDGFSEDTAIKMLDDIKLEMPNVSVDDSRILNRIGSNISKLVDNPNGTTAKAMDNVLRKEITGAKGNYYLSGILQDLRQTYRGDMPEQVTSALKKLDSEYPAYLAIKKAVSAAHIDDGKFTPKQLANASAQIAGQTNTALGRTPLEAQGKAALKTFSATDAPDSELIGWLRRVMQITPTMAPMKTMGKAALGQTAPQKAVKALGRSPVGQALRTYSPSAGKVGAALTQEN